MSSLTNGLPMLDGATAAVPLEQKFSASTGDGSAAPSQPLQNNRSVPMQFFGFNLLFQSLYTRNVLHVIALKKTGMVPSYIFS
uniref:Uncharacterized protein n=1 Tax=Zea mays TaxID=4577 RepID=B4FA03_MAIZE|nr:unknown [Zea mays]